VYVLTLPVVEEVAGLSAQLVGWQHHHHHTPFSLKLSCSDP